MLKIAISCGEGFASGFLAKHLQEEVVKAGMEDVVSFERIPFWQLAERQNEVDIAMILPHIEWKVKESKDTFNIPLYISPYKVAVKPSFMDFYEDAQDIIAMANGKGGLFAFPGEAKTAYVTRLVSHRTWVAQNQFSNETRA